MRRLFPTSLFGQTLAILLAGLIVSQAVGYFIYANDRGQAVRAVGGLATAQRIANLTQLVREAPDESQQRIVAALTDQTFRVTLSDQLPSGTPTDNDAPMAQTIRDFLVDQLSLVPAQQPGE